MSSAQQCAWGGRGLVCRRMVGRSYEGSGRRLAESEARRRLVLWMTQALAWEPGSVPRAGPRCWAFADHSMCTTLCHLFQPHQEGTVVIPM